MLKLNDAELKRAIRKLGIRWPGDGDYGFGTEVYVPGKNTVVRLIEQVDGKGSYRTEDGGLYTEKKDGACDYQPSRTNGFHRDEESLRWALRRLVVAYIVRRREPPTILHISFDDLVLMMKEQPDLAQTGEVGMDIALVPRGQKMSVDRRL